MNTNTKVVVDTITGEAFMRLHWELDEEVLVRVSNTITWDVERGVGFYAIGASSEL